MVSLAVSFFIKKNYQLFDLIIQKSWVKLCGEPTHLWKITESPSKRKKKYFLSLSCIIVKQNVHTILLIFTRGLGGLIKILIRTQIENILKWNHYVKYSDCDKSKLPYQSHDTTINFEFTAFQSNNNFQNNNKLFKNIKTFRVHMKTFKNTQQ